jgi:hypothetical protein
MQLVDAGCGEPERREALAQLALALLSLDAHRGQQVAAKLDNRLWTTGGAWEPGK